MFKAASQRRIREFNDRMEHAWMSARLTAYAPAKSDKFPKLKELMHQPETPRQHRQTPEQQLEIARAWMASRRR